MPRTRSQIQHDYKTLVKPAAHGAPKRPRRWFWAGLVIPLSVVVLMLAFEPAQGARPPAPLAIAAAPAGEEMSTPAAAAPHVATPAAPQPVDVAIAGRAEKRYLPLALPTRPANGDLVPAGNGDDDPALPQIELTISKGDTLDELFKAHGLSRGDLARILTLDNARQELTLLRPGDTVRIEHDAGAVHTLRREIDETKTLVITRGADGFGASIAEKPIEVRVTHASATIDSSLFLAGRAAGVSDTLIMNLAGIFAWDIDFVLDIRQGDRFAVVYEEIWQDGIYVRDGAILAARFDNDGDTFRAVRYADPDGEIGYFTPAGLSVRKAFLRAPVAISPRVTSSFNPKRYHPVHKKVRPHRGVDYGGPLGTPILAAGDGKVIFRGRKGGYGNTVILQHGGNITTLYAHLSRFNRNAKAGARVKQGQTIGYLGATGTVTGKHLHYEYRVNGVHRNPRTVPLPQAKPVNKKYHDDFKVATAPLIKQLNVISQDLRLAALD